MCHVTKVHDIYHVSITWAHDMQFHIWYRHQAADRAFTALVACSTILPEGAKLPSKQLVPFPPFFFSLARTKFTPIHKKASNRERNFVYLLLPSAVLK